MHVTRDRLTGFVTLWALSLFPLTVVFPSPLKTALYAALLCIAIYLLYTNSRTRQTYDALKPVALAFALYLPYSLASIWLQDGLLKTSDNGLHFLFFLLIAVCFRELRSQQFFWCGLSAAALGAGLLAIYQRFGLGIERPYGLYGINEFGMSGAIKFGMVTAVFSLLALIAAWDKYTPNRLRLWHGCAALVGFVGCQVIASRGPWLTMIVIAVGITLGKVLQLEGKQRWLTLFAGLLGAIGLIATFHAPLYDRFSMTLTELSTIQAGNYDTSIGARLAMWQAAMTLFKTHPLFGVGMNQFGTHLQALIDLGQAPPFIAIYGHTHNEYLEALATGGIAGMLYLLWLFGAPLFLFVRVLYRGNIENENRAAALGGLITVLSFALFAISDNIFDRQMSTSLFAFLVLGFSIMTVHGTPKQDL